MTLMRQLQETMRTENGCCASMRLARMQELQGEKAALAERYELSCAAFARLPNRSPP